MPPFRKVDPQFAGPSALGILVPPGNTTLVILRPRGLDWDLLPARWTGEVATPPVFCEFGRDEAAQVARQISSALADAALAGKNPLETFGKAEVQEYQIWVRAGEFFWIPCRSRPGQPYVPVIFTAKDEAENAARRLAPFLHPAADAGQEYYFNTQKFATPS